MSNRINIARWRKQPEYAKDWDPDVRHECQDYIDDVRTLLNALERCYEHERALLHEFQKMSAHIDGLRDILSLLEDRHDIDMSQFKDYLASE